MAGNRDLPTTFIQRIINEFGADSGAFLDSLHSKGSVSIRINPLKGYKPQELEQVPWCSEGYYLNERPVFTLDPLFHAGAYYVQEASSMFLGEVVRQTNDISKPLKVLDLCGAPGGKSTHLLSLLSNDSLLVSNEVIRSRAKILAENITKWGCPNVIVSNNDPSDFQQFTGFFDLLVIDAPCSGEGMFRKDGQAIEEWSEANVALCAARQRRIVADVWDALKPGGVLIYSTCTYNRSENEENLLWMIEELGATPLTIDISGFQDISPSSDVPGYHFFPHKAKGEGFFISALRKNEGLFFKPSKLKKKPMPFVSAQYKKFFSEWIIRPDNYDIWDFQNKALAFPKQWTSQWLSLIDKLSIVQGGTELGEVKARNVVPSHPLIVSTILDRKNFQNEELDLKRALQFLRKEELKPLSDEPYLLAEYQHTPLGLLKKAGNRYNNMYPKDWRIRMEL
jgi:16S rRNA C967 or C1407 C5-methylase (RsmB/RsmF family)/NOL1/NOP2/fmu family ribosome biogenesis protein